VRRALQVVLALTVALVLCAAADDPADRLPNPAQEARARVLFKQVRCLVCQSQSIDESDAPLAQDLRQLIRHDIAIGWSDDRIRAYLVSRYGDFPLESPRFSLGNAALWGVPLAVLIAGLSVLVVRARRKSPAQSVELTAEEEAVLQKLSGDEPL
jgi:cytochrome c-type biogenesis protein CcmH